MTEKHCIQSLLASSTHDMRNVLAVIRESTGLVQDMLRFGADVPNKERLLQALEEVQKQISKGALLTNSVDCLTKSTAGHGAGRCDGVRVAQAFCSMIARHAKAAHICCIATTAEQAVWFEHDALTVLQSLMGVFEQCTRAQAALCLEIRAARHEGTTGFYLTAEGEAAALEALASASGIQSAPPPWPAKLLPWREQSKQRFWLALKAYSA